MTTENRTVTSKELKSALRHLVKVNRPAFIWGSMGIGKSNIIADLCNEMGGKLYDLRLSQCEATDLRGMPYFDHNTGKMQWAPPVDLPSSEEAAQYPIVFLFLDEMNSAPPSIAAAAYQLVLDRKVGTYTLPDNVRVIAAGNRQGDRGVTYRMPAPLSNRLIHLELRADFDCWNEWAIEHGMHPDVVGYLNSNKGDLNDFDPKSPEHAFKTPRSWEFVHDIISDALDEKLTMDLVAGAIGEAGALKFMAHRRLAGSLPSPLDVLKQKVKKLKNTDISAQYSLMTSLLYELKEQHTKLSKDDNVDQWHDYCSNMIDFIMDNFEIEIQTMGMKMGYSTMKLPFNHYKIKSYTRFLNGPGKLILGSNKVQL